MLTRQQIDKTLQIYIQICGQIYVQKNQINQIDKKINRQTWSVGLLARLAQINRNRNTWINKKYKQINGEINRQLINRCKVIFKVKIQ